MPFRRTVVACLTAAMISASMAIGDAAQSDGSGGAMAEPSDGKQTWSFDAAVVSSANLALIWYASQSPVLQRRLESQADAIAKLRRTALTRVIESDPRQALLLSLSPSDRQGLPKRVLDLLEARLHARGDLTRLITENTPGDTTIDPQKDTPWSETSWTVRIGPTTRRAFVYGLRQKHQTKFDAPIHGIALDDLMAVSESPLYQYDLFETVQLGFQPGQIVATHGHLPIPLPDLEAFIDLREDLIAETLRFGPIPLPQPDTWTTGAKRLLVLKLNFRGDEDDPGTPEDERETPHSDGEITGGIGGANSFFAQNSQRRTSFVPLIVSEPLPGLPASVYSGASSRGLAHAMIADTAVLNARAYGYDPDAYDRIIVLTRQLFEESDATAAVGGRVVVVTGERAALWMTLTHELGHTYGFDHSNFWVVPFGADPIGPGEHREYGDAWDIMGLPNVDTESDWRRRHFNVFFKQLAGWLPASAVADGTAGGDFRLRRHDASDAAGLRAIFIRAGDGTTYWLGMRRQFPWNTSMANGIEVRRDMSDPRFTYGPVLLLDVDHGWTPGTPSGSSVFHSLAERNMFTDSANGLTIHTVVVGEDEMGEFARVFITR